MLETVAPPSRKMEKTRMPSPGQNRSIGSGCMNLWMPSYTENIPPIEKSRSATKKDQKYASRPRPSGYSWEGGLPAPCTPMSKSTWLVQSAVEWIASARRKPDPVSAAAKALAIAMATLTTSDWTMCDVFGLAMGQVTRRTSSTVVISPQNLAEHLRGGLALDEVADLVAHFENFEDPRPAPVPRAAALRAALRRDDLRAAGQQELVVDHEIGRELVTLGACRTHDAHQALCEHDG